MNIKKLLKQILPASFHKVECLSEKLENDIASNSQSISKLIDSLAVLNEEALHIKTTLCSLQEKQNIILAIVSSNDEEALLFQSKMINAFLDADSELSKSIACNHSLLDTMQKDLLDELHAMKEQFNKNMNDVLHLQKNMDDLLHLQKNMDDLLHLQKSMDDLLHLQKNMDDLLHLQKNMDDLLHLQKNMDRLLQENLWSAVFNNTIHDSSWLLNQSFSPGRWALGYPALYILYRILNDFTPCSILELGLGQSTKMIMQYAESHKDVTHFVVEHDFAWINFFLKNCTIPDNTHIVSLEREFVHYKNSANVRVFKDFKSTFETFKFDLIIVDAPLGGDMKEYSRIDILSLIDDNLCVDFVIILDDVNRQPERNTMKEITSKLDFSGISYSTKIYSGQKETCVWASPAWSFLCSL